MTGDVTRERIRQIEAKACGSYDCRFRKIEADLLVLKMDDRYHPRAASSRW
jgi:hypothetical protein